jgi:hypothetical protein
MKRRRICHRFSDGATATNPTTGEKLIRQNGQWVPLT